MYVSHELLLKEQRITPKFSFHTTQYANQRPDKLGNSLNEQILKDYNGQTYWLTYSPIKKKKWIGLALGYSASGMVGGDDNVWVDKNNVVQDYAYIPRYRQYFLSLDIDFTQIPTKSSTLKTVFLILNGIKIPAPAIELSRGKLQGHWIYF